LIVSAVILGTFTGFMVTSDTSREINWQEFRLNYLETGKVDKLVVSNKNTVRVYLKSANATADSHQSKPDFYFTIGSVESFERALDAVSVDVSVMNFF